MNDLNPANLSDAQRDGRACVTCHRDDRPMAPVGLVDGVQLFECASHEQDGGELYTRDQLRIAYYKGIVKGVEEPHVTRDEINAAARVAIQDIRDGQCEHEPTTNVAFDLAIRVGMLTAGQVAHESGVADLRDMSVREIQRIVTEAERDELIHAIRWILLKRQMNDVYPAVTA